MNEPSETTRHEPSTHTDDERDVWIAGVEAAERAADD